jgi:hypothetical protein
MKLAEGGESDPLHEIFLAPVSDVAKTFLEDDFGNDHFNRSYWTFLRGHNLGN